MKDISFDFAAEDFQEVFAELDKEPAEIKKQVIEIGNNIVQAGMVFAREAGFSYKGKGIMDMPAEQSFGLIVSAVFILGMEARRSIKEVPEHPPVPWTT